MKKEMYSLLTEEQNLTSVLDYRQVSLYYNNNS